MTTEEIDLIDSLVRSSANIDAAVGDAGQQYGATTISDGDLKLIRNSAQFILNDVADILAIRSNRG